MAPVVFDSPYKYVPALHSRFWPALLQPFLRRHLKKAHGLTDIECRGVEFARKSLDQGHSVLFTPNHSRLADPLTLGMLSRDLHTPMYAMASWHLFMQGWFQRFLVRSCGAFSIYREGLDRRAINRAIEILVTRERPLVVFPEGALSRTNDLLAPLADGTSLIARSAAKKLAKVSSSGKVMVHPVILKYTFHGDLEATLAPVLEDIERRLSWRPQSDLPLLDRVRHVGNALLALKELEFIGAAQEGEIGERLSRLIEHILEPMEQEWTAGRHDGNVVSRVRQVRTAILPDLICGDLDETERRRRWRQLAACTTAQQLSLYPPGYIQSRPTPERILETVEGFEEDLTDSARPHPPMRAVIQVGEALEVPLKRVRGERDPLTVGIEQAMLKMLDELAAESGEPLPLPDEPVAATPPQPTTS